jgi:hypothetical protein
MGTEELELAGQIPVTVIAGGEGELVREDQGACTGIAGGDVMVGIDRRGWNGGEPRWRRWSSTTAMVFRRGGTPAVDRRLGRSSREARRFD